ncbi:hypothetical protein N7540_002201 [Penicillium herquei]|nr:hypothetical protein N7540_002201 [Penicillium herquei]
MGTTSLWLIIGLMMSQLVSALSDIGYFDLPSGAGQCTSYEAVLARFINDAITLNDALKTAMSTVTSAAYSTEEEWADYYVARVLFDLWFGITFDANSEVATNAEAWDILEATTERLDEFFSDGDGDLTAPVYPAKLFCGGSMGNFFDWNANALDVDAKNVEVNGEGVAIQTLYSKLYAKRDESSGSFGTTSPYYLSSLNRYIFLGDKIQQDICATTMNGGAMYGLTIPGYHGAVETTTTLADDADSEGEGESEVKVLYDAMSEIVLICPNILTGSVYTYSTLADMSSATAIKPGSGTGLNRIVTSSSTMFHELIHLTTTWVVSTGDETTSINPDFVGDYTYDVGEALELAQGRLANPNKPSEAYAAVSAALNAQSYVFFTTAWYNWKNNPVSSDDSFSAAVYYSGLPENWYWPQSSQDEAFAMGGFSASASSSDAGSDSDS